MKFREAELYLYSLTNISSKEYTGKLKDGEICLNRLNYLLSILGNPQNKIQHYIHITGTSGKGSLTAYLHSILYTAAKIVGSMQSPHCTKITERWKIGAKNMTDKEFISVINKIKPALKKYIQTNHYSMLSYTEILTAIGLVYFAKNKVEWAVIEVGCGGRYDATNIIPNKDIAVITNIGVDHEDTIGPTEKDIAYHKAGIIKPKSQVFTMVADKNLLPIIEKECNKNKVNLKKIKKNNYKLKNASINSNQFNYLGTDYTISTPGTHQINNAIVAIEIAKYLNIDTVDIKKALQKTKQILRLELFCNNKIILDGAHNEDKMESTVKFIENFKKIYKKDVHILVGFSDNKRWKEMVKKLARLKPKTVCISRNTTNLFRKAANPGDIKTEFHKYKSAHNLNIFLEPEEALEWVKKKMKKNDILLVTGSIFLSGQIRPRLTQHLSGKDIRLPMIEP